MAQKPPVWHREDIKAALRKRHGSLRALSKGWGYSRRAVSNVLEDPHYSRRLEKLVSQDLGVELHVLWPDRWAADGSPVPGDGDHRDITEKSRKSCQKRKAA